MTDKKKLQEFNKNLPIIKKSISDFLYEEEGNITRGNILYIGSLLVISGFVLSQDPVFASHGSHSSHASHASHASGSGGYTTPSTDTTSITSMGSVSTSSIDSDPINSGGVKVSLSWNAPTLSNIHHYEIYRSNIPLIDGTKIADVDSSKVTYEDTSVKASTTYYYTVYAVDSNSTKIAKTSYSSILTNSDGDNILPSDINDGSGQGYIVDGKLVNKITWGKLPDNDVKYYKVFRSDSPEGYISATRIAENIPSDTTTFEDKDVKSGHTYYYYVTAINDKGLESYSAKGIGVKTLETAPVKIDDISVQSNIIDGNAVNIITWSKSSDNDIKYYKVFRSNSSGDYSSATQVGESVSYDITTFVDKNVEPESTYYYYVTATNESGYESSPGKEISVKTLENEMQTPQMPDSTPITE